MSIPRVNVLIFSLLASIFCTTAESEIYKVVDKNTGKVTYTNTKPLEGSSSSFEKISEKPINSLGGSSSVTESSTSYRPTTSHESSSVEEAFDNHQSNVQVSGYGRVKKILPLDNNGSRHQKFILQLPSGKTLLVAHNIDLAPEITSLSVGDAVEFFGEYEWNEKGGVIHWTHHDPNGSHIAGWLRHSGRTYQ
jgi:hypothetical protein